MTPDFWRGKRVLVTGHTGFKGGWLCLWLHSLGAEVHGYALAPPTTPALFELADIGGMLASHTVADIREQQAVIDTMRRVRPDVVFHLAAQPLVRHSYQAPVETFAVNVMGTAHLLESVRQVGGVRAVVNVTTDKCYENREWHWGYRETEPMGGHDPYSSSKGCAELVSAAYRSSYFGDTGPHLATARAGNVIGGGDWAGDRLVPDFLRAVDAGTTLQVRSPDAVRPWQHVLEPLRGYLMLAEALHGSAACAEPWNFGPVDADARSVRWILDHLSRSTPGVHWVCDSAPQPHEAHFLKLDSSKAHARLGWHPLWRLDRALDMTMAWHQAWRRGEPMRDFTLAQIATYAEDAATSGSPA